ALLEQLVEPTQCTLEQPPVAVTQDHSPHAQSSLQLIEQGVGMAALWRCQQFEEADRAALGPAAFYVSSACQHHYVSGHRYTGEGCQGSVPGTDVLGVGCELTGFE